MSRGPEQKNEFLRLGASHRGVQKDAALHRRYSANTGYKYCPVLSCPVHCNNRNVAYSTEQRNSATAQRNSATAQQYFKARVVCNATHSGKRT